MSKSICGVGCANLLVAALLTACVHIEKAVYPQYLPALAAQPEGCRNFVGAFENRDLAHEKGVPLAYWFAPSAHPSTDVDRVTLETDEPGTLRIRFLASDDQILSDRVWREGKDYRCADGVMEFRPETFKFFGVISNDVLRLQRNVRGDLVAREAGVAGGVVLVVPLYVQVTGWHAYRNLEE